MARIIWSASLESGVAGVDQQHQEMFHRVNEFLDACAHGKGREHLTGALDFLHTYCSEHFAMEERLMRTYAYPDYDTHVELHADLLDLTRELKSTVIEKAPTAADVNRFATSLEQWLHDHISGEDMKVFRFLRDRKGRTE